MKKVIIALFIALIAFTSCNPYIATGGGCGAWYKKHYSGKAPKQKSFARMPVIN